MKTAKDILDNWKKSDHLKNMIDLADAVQAMEEYAEQFKQPSSEPMLIPFDLSVALVHPERVVMKNTEKKILEIYCYKKWSNGGSPVACVVANADGIAFGIYYYDITGKNGNDDETLFLLAETKTMWVNVYQSNLKEPYAYGKLFSSEAMALQYKYEHDAIGYISTAAITIPVK